MSIRFAVSLDGGQLRCSAGLPPTGLSKRGQAGRNSVRRSGSIGGTTGTAWIDFGRRPIAPALDALLPTHGASVGLVRRNPVPGRANSHAIAHEPLPSWPSGAGVKIRCDIQWPSLFNGAISHQYGDAGILTVRPRAQIGLPVPDHITETSQFVPVGL